LEILDNGQHLGWADVVDGKWDYAHSGLPVAAHSLTASYKGKESPAWSVSVELEKPHEETFETAPMGTFFALSRPYYQGATSYEGHLGNGVNPPTRILEGGNNPGSGKSLLISSFNGRAGSSGDYSTVYVMDFKEEYSVVSFRSTSQTGWEGRASVTVEALDASRGMIETHTFPSPEFTTATVTVRGTAQRKIKFLRFSSRIVVPDAWHALYVDDLTMTK
jgi:hypothetical protein